MPTPDLFRHQIIWQRSSADAAVNVLHWDFTEGQPLGLSNQDVADIFASEVASAAAVLTAGTTTTGLMSQSWSIDRVTIRDLRIPNQPEFSSTVGVVGTNTSQTLPSSNAVVVTLRTAKAGRSFRGRTYIPGWSAFAVTATGAISSTAREAAEDFITGLQAGVAAEIPGAVLVVYSRTLDETNPVVSVQVRDDQWDVQRRRNVPGI